MESLHSCVVHSLRSLLVTTQDWTHERMSRYFYFKIHGTVRGQTLPHQKVLVGIRVFLLGFLLVDRWLCMIGLLSILTKIWAVHLSIWTHNSTTLQSHIIPVICYNSVFQNSNSRTRELWLNETYVVIWNRNITSSKLSKHEWKFDKMTVQPPQNDTNRLQWTVSKQKTIYEKRIYCYPFSSKHVSTWPRIITSCVWRTQRITGATNVQFSAVSRSFWYICTLWNLTYLASRLFQGASAPCQKWTF